MRVLCVALVALMGIIRCQGQPVNSPLNAYVKDILYTQMSGPIGLRLPLIVNLGGFIYFREIKVANNRVYFHQKRRIENYATYTRKMVNDEIRQSLTTQFVNACQPGAGLQLKAYDQDRLLISLTYQDRAQQQRLMIETLSNPFTKEVNYKDYQQQSIAVKKRQTLFSGEEFRYSKFPACDPDESSRRRQPVDTVQRANLLTSIAYYAKASDQTLGKLMKTEWLSYDENGQLATIHGSDGLTKDSTRFTYNRGQLIRRDYAKKTWTLSQTYDYNTDLQVRTKTISTSKKQYEIRYCYDVKHRVEGIEVHEKSARFSKKLSFTYDAKSELLSIRVTKCHASTGKTKVAHQYAFTYDSMGNIERLRELNRRGKILKEINFQLNFL